MIDVNDQACCFCASYLVMSFCFTGYVDQMETTNQQYNIYFLQNPQNCIYFYSGPDPIKSEGIESDEGVDAMETKITESDEGRYPIVSETSEAVTCNSETETLLGNQTRPATSSGKLLELCIFLKKAIVQH